MNTISIVDELATITKHRFAVAYLRTKNAATAAMEVISDPGTALKMSRELPHDPVVLDEIERLTRENGEDSFLPTKAAIAREVYERAKKASCDEDYERLTKLYCNIMGHIEKPGTNVNVGLQVSNVMVVKDHGTVEEWQDKLAVQQRGLTLNAAN